MKALLKAMSIVVLTLTMLMVALVWLVNSAMVQNRLVQYAVKLLKEQLQTEVSIKHVCFSLRREHVTVMGLEVEDRQRRKMLQIKEVNVRLDIKSFIRNREVVVTAAHIGGLQARLCKPATPKDSVANYKFLIEAFKPQNHQDKDNDMTPEKRNKRLVVLRASNITIDVDSLRFTTDNGKQRRNTGKPHHGFFDAGHLDVRAALKLELHNISAEGCHIVLTDCHAEDPGAKWQIDSLRLTADITKDSMVVSDVQVRLPNTSLDFERAIVHLPNERKNRVLRYHTSTINGSTQLKDIAKTFAPVLQNFKIPLQFRCSLIGVADNMSFNDVHVETTDKRLKINAKGGISHLSSKEQLHIYFDIGQMKAIGDVKERIINQFTVKKFMMKQLRNLGNIGYRGHFDILYKKEKFQGKLTTEVGNLDFRFSIDEKQKYLTGTVKTTAIDLGQVMDMDDMGKIACHADFKIDISKPRTAKMRLQKGGKLPIGSVDAKVQEANYKFIKVKNVDAHIISDGAIAEGYLVEYSKLIDITCRFSFTNTDKMQETKIRPGLKIHLFKKKKNKHSESF